MSRRKKGVSNSQAGRSFSASSKVDCAAQSSSRHTRASSVESEVTRADSREHDLRTASTVNFARSPHRSASPVVVVSDAIFATNFDEPLIQ